MVDVSLFFIKSEDKESGGAAKGKYRLSADCGRTRGEDTRCSSGPFTHGFLVDVGVRLSELPTLWGPNVS